MTELYLTTSLFIGFILLIEARYILRKQEVRVNKFTLFTSTIELVWFVVSVAALSKLPLTQYQALIPTLYITHNILGWLYGIWLAKSLAQQQSTHVVIPTWYAKFAHSYAIVFIILCISVAVM
jgi:hypothetical protein